MPAPAAEPKMRSIEGARALAAMAVALMHCANLMRVEHFSGHVGLGGLFDFGYVGVDFFFVLSGFIIAYVHHADLGRPAAAPAYLWRRLSRVYPIFWVCLVLQILVVAGGRLVLGKPTGIDFAPVDIASTWLLAQIVPPKFVEVAWSLQYEVLFYLAFTLLIFSKRLGLALLGLWTAVVIAGIAGLHSLPALILKSPHCLQFVAGIGIGLLVRARSFPRLGRGALAGAIALLVLAVVYEMNWSPQPHRWDGRLALGLGSAAVLFALVELEKRHALRTPAWLHRLGSVSYSIYLSHIMFINLIFSLLLKFGWYHRLPEGAVFALGFAGAMAGAMALGFTVELPLVNRLKPLVGRPAPGR